MTSTSLALLALALLATLARAQGELETCNAAPCIYQSRCMNDQVRVAAESIGIQNELPPWTLTAQIDGSPDFAYFYLTARNLNFTGDPIIDLTINGALLADLHADNVYRTTAGGEFTLRWFVGWHYLRSGLNTFVFNKWDPIPQLGVSGLEVEKFAASVVAFSHMRQSGASPNRKACVYEGVSSFFCQTAPQNPLPVCQSLAPAQAAPRLVNATLLVSGVNGEFRANRIWYASGTGTQPTSLIGLTGAQRFDAGYDNFTTYPLVGLRNQNQRLETDVWKNPTVISVPASRTWFCVQIESLDGVANRECARGSMFSAVIEVDTTPPTSTPAPTPEPTIAGSPPAPNPNPTPNPSPDPTPNPSPDPTPNPTPDPTPNPTPDPTPNPTPDPTPNPSPGPTANPTPDPTPNPTPDPTPDPTPIPTQDCVEIERAPCLRLPDPDTGVLAQRGSNRPCCIDLVCRINGDDAQDAEGKNCFLPLAEVPLLPTIGFADTNDTVAPGSRLQTLPVLVDVTPEQLPPRKREASLGFLSAVTPASAVRSRLSALPPQNDQVQLTLQEQLVSENRIALSSLVDVRLLRYDSANQLLTFPDAIAEVCLLPVRETVRYVDVCTGEQREAELQCLGRFDEARAEWVCENSTMIERTDSVTNETFVCSHTSAIGGGVYHTLLSTTLSPDSCPPEEGFPVWLIGVIIGIGVAVLLCVCILCCVTRKKTKERGTGENVWGESASAPPPSSMGDLGPSPMAASPGQYTSALE